jgi:anti-sigma regulatory factor (Ser/Thr protein kinase)/putative methionine-R-sulfoxide reductase with GAF domain
MSDAQTTAAGERYLEASGRLGVGQVALQPASTIDAPSERIQALYNLSDPALSELGLNELLDELLLRVRSALQVDTVAVLLYEEETQQLVARAAKGIEEEVEQGVRIPIGRGFAGRIAAERVAIFIADVDHADILNPILREKGIRSLLGVPLIVEGSLIGVMHVGSLRPRRFVANDVAVLQLAAARVAPGIDRARLYSALEREHQVAMVLQRSLLPRHLIEVPGVSLAARYLPARNEVGGDWYDVIDLPHGLVGLAIGDVVGHGVRAAALMGRLRTALHAYALSGHSPGQTLELVDRFMRNTEVTAMATAAYAVFHPESGKLTFATAGHLPPLITGDSGGHVLEVTPAVPLGAYPYARYEDREIELEEGQSFVLYTDGLVERPGSDLDAGIAELLELVARARTPEAACMLAVDRLVPPGGARDDVAILAVQSTPVPEELFLQLPADPNMLSRTRRQFRRWLRHHGGSDSDLAEATIALSEACANAVEHAYSPMPASFEIRARCDAGELVISVKDAGRWRAPRGTNRGRGLAIMKSAMDEVSIERTDAGTEVIMRRRLGAR